MLNCSESLLMVIDVQGKLADAVENAGFHRGQVKNLILGVSALSIPVILTVQVPGKLGSTVPEIQDLLPVTKEIPRTAFSAFREVEILAALHKNARKQILLCGYEAHICLYQTAMDLLQAGYEVYFIVDAISSRQGMNKEVALQRVAQAGGKLATVEMVLYELLRDASHPVFKTILNLIK